MFTKKFWIDAMERAIKTFAQALLAAGVLDPLSTDLSTTLTTKLVGALLAAGVSVLTSVASTGFGQGDSASVIDTKGDDGAVSTSTAVFVACLVGAFLLGYILRAIGVGT